MGHHKLRTVESLRWGAGCIMLMQTVHLSYCLLLYCIMFDCLLPNLILSYCLPIARPSYRRVSTVSLGNVGPNLKPMFPVRGVLTRRGSHAELNKPQGRR